MYWSRAAFRPLDIAPEVETDDEDAVRGPKFLRDFERKRREEVAMKKDEASSVAPLPAEI